MAPIGVIGAGLGGLAAAVRLARAGRAVTVFEAHTEPGGLATVFTRARERHGVEAPASYRFDASLHHLDAVGPGEANRPVLEALGVAGDLELFADPVLRRELAPGRDLWLPQGAPALIATLSAVSPEDGGGLHAIVGLASAEHDRVYGRGIGGGSDVHRATAAEILTRHLTSPVLREVLGALCGYVGRQPEVCPAGIFLMLVHAYHSVGGWRLRGGSAALTRALCGRLLEAGGTLVLGAKVAAIRLHNGRVVGVGLRDGREEPLSAAVAALPLPLLPALLPDAPWIDTWKRRISALPRSISFDQLSVGLRGDHTAGQAYETRIVGPRGVNFVTIPSVGDPGWAPPGCTSATVTARVPPVPRSPEALCAAEAALRDVLRRLFPSLDADLEVSSFAHPGTWERYTGAPDGATMGADLEELETPRTPVPGLVLAGAWVRPGPGQTAVMASGLRAAQLLLGGGA